MSAQAPLAAHPRVFISYSHESTENEDRVLALAERLRADGIDAIVDQYFPVPSTGWPRWTEREIRTAGFVLMACTETYQRRVDGQEEQGKGRGVVWEANIIYNLLYASGVAGAKFIPILFDPAQGTIYQRRSSAFRITSSQPRRAITRLSATSGTSQES
jgi:hypothetical protein